MVIRLSTFSVLWLLFRLLYLVVFSQFQEEEEEEEEEGGGGGGGGETARCFL